MIKKIIVAVIIIVSILSFQACSTASSGDFNPYGVDWCKYSMANMVIENFNEMYPDCPITSDDIIVNESTKATIRITDDVFFEILSDKGDPVFSVGGFNYLNVYNREILYGYAKALSDASFKFSSFDPSLNSGMDLQQAILSREFPVEFFEWSKNGEKITYYENKTPSVRDGMKYTMLLTIKSNIVKYIVVEKEKMFCASQDDVCNAWFDTGKP